MILFLFTTIDSSMVSYISGTVMSNFTCLDFFIAPVLLSYIRNAGDSRSYPMNVPSYERTSSLLLCLSTATKH